MYVIRIMLLTVVFLQKSGPATSIQVKHPPLQPKPTSNWPQQRQELKSTSLAVARFKCTCFSVDYILNRDDVTVAQESYIATDKEAHGRTCESLIVERLEERGIALTMLQLREYCMSCTCTYDHRNLVLMKVVAYGITWCLFMLVGLLAILQFAPKTSEIPAAGKDIDVHVQLIPKDQGRGK